MGLTIHYSLRSTHRRNDDARRLVDQLRQRALDLPFKQVGDLIDLKGDSCGYERRADDDPHRWLLIQANQPIERERYVYHVAPAQMFAFTTVPGDGSEPANFGLCRYPRTFMTRDGRNVRTGLPSGWHWSSFCKTQYASNPELGGVENFLRCHLSIIRLLDHAQSMQMVHSVSDEGGYWQRRDAKALVDEVGEWNTMIAGFVGQMKDLMSDGARDVQSEITNYSNYEHLEAEGRPEANA